MTLVDTSVWVSHFRTGEPQLEQLLEEGRVLCHPLVIGELACVNLPRRAEVLGYLRELPDAVVAAHDEALHFIEQHSLMGRGIGYEDVHLLASAVLTPEATLWTRDLRLAAAAAHVSVAWTP